MALARRIIRDYTSRDENTNVADVEEVSLKALDKELRFYLTCSRQTYAHMPKTQVPASGLVVDGTKMKDEIVNEILTYINTCNHYDALINENNDPVHDSEPLTKYMNKWDGNTFIEALQLTVEKSVLEIGVGTGRLAIRLCGKCGHFTGIDISFKTVERAKQNLQHFDNASLICGNFLTYAFNEKFDIIYSSLTFMHIEDKRAAIIKIAKLLNPNGRFILSIDKNQQREISYSTRRIAVYPDTSEEITALITETGLTIENQVITEFAVIFTARKEL